MSGRQILIVLLMLAALIVPLIELSIGFYYVNSTTLCPLQNDIMVLMSIGGVFDAIFFAAFFGFVFAITPAQYKKAKKVSEGQAPAKSANNRGSQLLLGKCLSVDPTFVSPGIFRRYHAHFRRLCNDVLRSAASPCLSQLHSSSIDQSQTRHLLFTDDFLRCLRADHRHLCCISSRLCCYRGFISGHRHCQITLSARSEINCNPF